MKITHIEPLPVTVGIDPEIMITSSLGTHRGSRYVLVKVHTDEGITGIGEATVMPMWSGETQGGTKVVIKEYLAPALVGEDPFNVEHLLWKMERAVVGNPFSKAALEMTLLDLIGKKLHVPVYQLLGGRCRSERIPIKFVFEFRLN